MRYIYRLAVTVLISILLTYTLTQTLCAYNLRVNILNIVDEKEILENVTKSPLKKVEGDIFTFENGVLDFSRRTYDITGVPQKFKHIDVDKKNVKSVKFNTKTNTGQTEFESNRLYAITYKFKVKKDVYNRVIMVYCNDYERTR